MTTRNENTPAFLKRRIRQFYKLLNQQRFEGCYQMIDPRVRLKPSSVALFQYQNALREFLDQFGAVEVIELTVDLHSDEPSELYEGSDFALGKTTWTDEAGEQHVFSERWVWEDEAWYTRSTGVVTPST